MTTPNTSTAAPGYEANARAIFDEVKKLHAHEIVSVPGPDGTVTQFAVVPKGKDLVNLRTQLEEARERPARVIGRATLEDAASFITHVCRFADAQSVVFADPTRATPSFTAVYDYHQASGDDDCTADDVAKRQPMTVAGSLAGPRWAAHRARYAPRLSDQWKAWLAADGKGFSQAEFAEFLEQRVVDVWFGEPGKRVAEMLEAIEARLATPSQLVLLSRNIAINVDTAVRHAQVLSSGEINVQYVESHRDGDGAPIRIPNAFLLSIPVFFNGDPYEVLVRLRYRLSGGKIVWFFQLHRHEEAFDHAYTELCQRIATRTSVPVLLGAPEA